MSKFRKLNSMLLIAAMVMSVQIMTLSSASAAADTDLVLNAQFAASNQAITSRVCNNGTTAIKQIVFDLNATNITFHGAFVSPIAIPPTDPGSADLDTLTWTGLVDASECVDIVFVGSDSGVFGDTVTATLSIASSIQFDDTANTDTNSGNDSVVLDPFTIVALPDLATDAHIITTGEITASTEVEYEINMQNVGEGAYVDGGFNIFAFILPADATFVGVTDLNPSDGIDANNSNCHPAGVLGVDINLPGAIDFLGRYVVACQLGIVDGEVPAGDTIYPFSIKIVAGASMAAGTADVIGVFEGDDPDTMDMFFLLSQGDLLDVVNNASVNNIFYLSYDPEALTATSSLCPGQGATTTDGTACFRITFNKKIYAPSFTADDIDIDGNGTVDSVTKVSGDDVTWEVRISGIAPGTTLTMLLNINGIQDYSAQQNSTQVLGINTIRYTVDDGSGTSNGSVSESTSAGGTLAETGINGSDLATPIMLLLVGFALAFSSRRKQIVSRATYIL